MYASLVAQEGTDFLDLYGRDPNFLAINYPKVYDAIWKALVDHLAPLVEEMIQERYVGGFCTFCKGDAKTCSERHSQGKSCGLGTA